MPPLQGDELSSQEDMKRKLEKTRDELILHAAKSVIADTATSGFRFFAALLSLGVFLVPAYAALVRLLLGETIRDVWLIASIPIALWLGGILLCLYLMFPRMAWADMQNPIGIVESNREALAGKLRLSKIATVFFFLGIVLAACVLFIPTDILLQLEALSSANNANSP